MENKKPDQNKRPLSLSTSSNSPPKKKQDILAEKVDPFEVEMKDLDKKTCISNVDCLKNENDLLKNKIKELEVLVEVLKDKVESSNSIRQNLDKHIKELTGLLDLQHRNPLILSKVQDAHLALLDGYKYVYKADPDGACLQNAVAVHIYEDPNQGPKLKRDLNDHIAENWNYNRNNTTIPYHQTVGVCQVAYQIKIDNDDDMISF